MRAHTADRSRSGSRMRLQENRQPSIFAWPLSHAGALTPISGRSRPGDVDHSGHLLLCVVVVAGLVLWDRHAAACPRSSSPWQLLDSEARGSLIWFWDTLSCFSTVARSFSRVGLALPASELACLGSSLLLRRESVLTLKVSIFFLSGGCWVQQQGII